MLPSLRFGDASGIVNIPHILSLLYVTNWSLWRQSCFLRTSSIRNSQRPIYQKKDATSKLFLMDYGLKRMDF